MVRARQGARAHALAVGEAPDRPQPVADVPEAFKGTSIALITAGIMSLAFMGFAGLIKV